MVSQVFLANLRSRKYLANKSSLQLRPSTLCRVRVGRLLYEGTFFWKRDKPYYRRTVSSSNSSRQRCQAYETFRLPSFGSCCNSDDLTRQCQQSGVVARKPHKGHFFSSGSCFPSTPKRSKWTVPGSGKDACAFWRRSSRSTISTTKVCRHPNIEHCLSRYRSLEPIIR